MTTSVPRKLKYIMYNVQDYNVLYNSAVHPVVCEGWHVTHMWNTLVTWRHHFTKRGSLG
jgi:hypothetical protein